MIKLISIFINIFLNKIFLTIFLLLLFIIVIFPTGIILKIFKLSLLKTKFDKRVNSYWLEKNKIKKFNFFKK